MEVKLQPNTLKLRIKDSFVAQTYKKEMEHQEHIFYSEEKQMIYMTKKVGELVLSCHFQISQAWSNRRVNSCESDIISAIMEKRQNLILQ
jgi:hypothetical protein